MTIRQLEHISTQTILGVRFWDAARDAIVADGLDVRAWLLSEDRSRRAGRVVRGRPTPNGVYALFGLYRSAESLPPSTPSSGQLWEGLPPARRVVVEVRDPLGRYLSVAFEVEVPFRGAFRGEGGWLAQPLLLPSPPAGQARGVQLWPAAGYRVPPGLTVIRALVVVGPNDDAPPARFALAEVRRPGPGSTTVTHASGLTDEQGRLTMALGYPPIPDPTIPVPPPADPTIPEELEPGDSEPSTDPPQPTVYPPLADQEFALRVRFAGPLIGPPSPGSPPRTLPGSNLPNLAVLLRQTAYRVAVQRDGVTLTLADELPVTLRYGVPLAMRTARPAPAPPEGVLRIAP